MRRLFLLLLFAMSCACAAPPQHQVTTLPNGKQLNVLSVSKTYSTNGVNSWLTLTYQTDIPIEDVDALSKEVEEIWPYFKNDVEQAGMNEALITASSAPVGTIIKESKSYSFAYKKSSDGSWSRSGG